MANTYTVLNRDYRVDGSLFRVFVDNLTGFDAFIEANGLEALPGSTVDIADLQQVMRLRHDGSWEKYQSYAVDAEQQAAAEEAAVAAVVDDLIPDEEIEESEETA